MDPLAGIAFGGVFDDTEESIMVIPSGIYRSPFPLQPDALETRSCPNSC